MPKNPYKASKAEEQQLRSELLALSNILFVLYEDATFDDIGRRAKLHPNTVRNLWGGVTQFPQFRTMQKLAVGAGVSLMISQDGIAMSLSGQ